MMSVQQSAAYTGSALGLYEHLSHGSTLGLIVVALHAFAWALSRIRRTKSAH